MAQRRVITQCIHTENQGPWLLAQCSFNVVMILLHFTTSEKRKSFQNVILFQPTLSFGHSVQTQSLISHRRPGTQLLVLVMQRKASKDPHPTEPTRPLPPVRSGWQSRERETDDGDKEGMGGTYLSSFFLFILRILYDSFLLSYILDVFQTINFTHLKHTMIFTICIKLCNYHCNLNLGHFPHPTKKHHFH